MLMSFHSSLQFPNSRQEEVYFGEESRTLLHPNTDITIASMEAQVNYTMLDKKDSDLMQSYIDAAYIYAEKMTRQVIHQRRITLSGSSFPNSWVFPAIAIPYSPLQSIDRIWFMLPDGSATQDFTGYQVRMRYYPKKIYAPINSIWPNVQPGNVNAVYIQLTAGYQGSIENVPPSLLVAIRQVAATYWQNRESISDVAMVPIPMSTQSILMTHRLNNRS